MKRFPKGTISPSLMPRDHHSSADGGGSDLVNSPSKTAAGAGNTDGDDAFKKILDSSTMEIQDEEIKRDINFHMEHILQKRIEEKAESFEKNVFGNSLQVIK